MPLKRTRKWEFVKQEAIRLAALGLNASDIAARLEVRPSTVTRWFASGKLVRPEAFGPPLAVGAGRKSPTEWAEAVRADLLLSETDEQRLLAAEAALGMAHDVDLSPAIRLNAMRTFQALARDLALVPSKGTLRMTEPAAPEDEEHARPARPIPVDVIDPRIARLKVN